MEKQSCCPLSGQNSRQHVREVTFSREPRGGFLTELPLTDTISSPSKLSRPVVPLSPEAPRLSDGESMIPERVAQAIEEGHNSAISREYYIASLLGLIRL